MSFQQKRTDFLKEIDFCAKQVDEYKTWGDITEAPKYLKRIRVMDEKLNQAATMVSPHHFFEEERALVEILLILFICFYY